MSELQQLKRKLVRGAVAENIDLVLGRRRNERRLRRDRQFPLIPAAVLGALLATSLPYLSAAFVPEGTERFASWVYSIPGTESVRGTLAAARSSNTATDERLPNSPETPTDIADVITVSAADTLEELDLRFEEPGSFDREVFDLIVQRVILDPGHGGEHLGTSAGNLAEKDITLDIAVELRTLLQQKGFEVYLTREDDRSVELDDRVRFANDARGDIFLSIHVNWLGERTLRGVETFHLGTTNDPELKRRVSMENRESGYTLTDFRRLLDRIYVDLRRDESRSLAREIQRSMYTELKKRNPAVRDRGVKQAPFMVLIGTEMPAVLAEVSSLSNQDDATLLRSREYRKTIAGALADGVVAYAESLRPDPSFETKVPSDPATVAPTPNRPGPTP